MLLQQQFKKNLTASLQVSEALQESITGEARETHNACDTQLGSNRKTKYNAAKFSDCDSVITVCRIEFDMCI